MEVLEGVWCEEKVQLKLRVNLVAKFNGGKDQR